MDFTNSQLVQIEASMADFLLRRRPLKPLRDHVDVTYRIKRRTVVIYEVRICGWNRRRKIKSPVAKATCWRNPNRLKIYWHRADMRWHCCDPHPEAGLDSRYLTGASGRYDGVCSSRRARVRQRKALVQLGNRIKYGTRVLTDITSKGVS